MNNNATQLTNSNAQQSMSDNVPMFPAKSAALSMSRNAALYQGSSATQCMKLSAAVALALQEVVTAPEEQAVQAGTVQKRRKSMVMERDLQMNKIIDLAELMELQEVKEAVEDLVDGLGVAQVDLQVQVAVAEGVMGDLLNVEAATLVVALAVDLLVLVVDQAMEDPQEVEAADVKVFQNNSVKQFRSNNARVCQGSSAEL